MIKIAFMITVYKNDNYSYFVKAIESIVNQDYGFENINIYLGVDGDIPNNIKNFIESNSELFYKVIYNKKNMGLAYSLNRLIDILDDEEYIFRMDADDICRTNRVSEQMLYFHNDESLILLGSDLIEIDENGKQLRYKKMPVGKHAIVKYSISRNPFNHPTVAMKRDFFDLVGKYKEDLLKSQDYELWARALKMEISCTNINKPLIYFRVTSNYLQKRNSYVNYLTELKISYGLAIYFRYYTQMPKVFIKFIIRLMPIRIGEFAYKIIRSSF